MKKSLMIITVFISAITACNNIESKDETPIEEKAEVAVIKDTIKSTNANYYAEMKSDISTDYFILKKNGTLWRWGYTLQVFEKIRLIPEREIISISSGMSHLIALKKDGTVWSIGSNTLGSLGRGNFDEHDNSMNGVQVKNLNGIISIAAGAVYSSIALKNDSTVWAWGDNLHGELGDGTRIDRNTPVQVKNLTGIIAISAGDSYCLALKNDGTVWGWGSNYYGQLGNGEDKNRYNSTPIQAKCPKGIIAIATGQWHSLALKDDGTVWAWGDGLGGALGNKKNINYVIPTKVEKIDRVIAIAAGDGFSLALKKDSTVWSWGSNNENQLGYENGEYLNLSQTNKESYGNEVPKQIKSFRGIVAISAKKSYSLAINNNESLFFWGNWSSSGFGLLMGNKEMEKTKYPIEIKGIE